MLSNNNDQSANGNTNSNVLQVNGDYYGGITEERARLICREEYEKVLAEWSFEAGVLVEKRVQKLEDKLLPKMIAQDETLKIFGDPSFQLLIRKAQISAACSEREDDYEMLAELLLHRSEQNDNRERRLGITKAVEIVDQLDESALRGLATVLAMSRIVPTSDSPMEALNAWNYIISMAIDDKPLPVGLSWIEHLDLLSAVRMGLKNINGFKRSDDFISEQLPKFFYLGLSFDDEKLKDLKGRFIACGLPLSCFKKHDFKKGYEKLCLYNEVDDIRIIANGQELPLTSEQKALVSEAKTLMQTRGNEDQELTSGFWNLWNAFPGLKMAREWWDTLPISFTFTPVGLALANAYIHGKDPSVPCQY